jgi:hypothetical protein
MAGAALLFTALAFGLGLATRGVSCATRRLTLLWPIPGRPEAAEQTVFAVYGGMGHTADVTFPGHVGILPLSAEGAVGGGFTCDATPGNPGVVRDLRVGLWETRLLLAEGVRVLGGPVTAELTADGASLGVRVTNRSAIPLGGGCVWGPRSSAPRLVPAVASGAIASADLPMTADGTDAELAAALGFGGAPAGWDAAALFGNAITNLGPRETMWDQSSRRQVAARDGAALQPALVYLAPVDPAALPGGGPTLTGGHSEMDVVIVVVPLAPIGDGG